MTNVKNRYQAIVEQWDRYGKQMKELTIECDLGKRPTIGDYMEAFKKEGFDVTITDFTNMTFKPKDPASTPVTSLRIVRTVAIG